VKPARSLGVRRPTAVNNAIVFGSQSRRFKKSLTKVSEPEVVSEMAEESTCTPPSKMRARYTEKNKSRKPAQATDNRSAHG
jgi:hypothetical protein